LNEKFESLKYLMNQEIKTAVKRYTGKMTYDPIFMFSKNKPILTDTSHSEEHVDIKTPSSTSPTTHMVNLNVSSFLPGFNYKDFMVLMNAKANKDELDHLVQTKTNKTDSENQMKAIDILHRQVQHLIVLLIEVAQQLMNE
jgi:hypothetical protein